MLPKDRAAVVRYVALGDSTVEGVGATSPEASYVGLLYTRLRAVYPNAQLSNLGLAGATAVDVVDKQIEPAVRLEPSLVTLSIGPNDLTQGRDATAFEDSVETILATLTKRTRAAVIVNLLLNLAVAPRFSPEEKVAIGQLTRAFNAALERQARQHGAAVVDLYRPSQEEVPDRGGYVSADDYHPSDAGYARWAELMWPAIEARIGS